MISATQAAEYIEAQLGVRVPAFLLTAACARVETAEAAMLDAGYAEHDVTLMQAIAVALVAGGDSGRQLQSQAAPSGASRSFKYRSDDATRLRRQLQALDTANLLADIVGPDPAVQTAFLVV